jgi:hypothetical protein
MALDLLDRARTNGFHFSGVFGGTAFAVDDPFVQELRSRGYGVVLARHSRSKGNASSTQPSPSISGDVEGAATVAEPRVARIGEEALETFELLRHEIGLDHFEVRTYQSLVRHLALSSASILFLAMQGYRVPPRRHSSASISRAL